jgi:hypothetical protein
MSVLESPGFWSIVDGSRQPGAALPWRVFRLPASSFSRSLKAVPGTSGRFEGRLKKPVRAGKKRRIAIRRKYAAEVKAAEAEKEKRARKNREKKLKKREKNRKAKEPEVSKELKDDAG